MSWVVGEGRKGEKKGRREEKRKGGRTRYGCPWHSRGNGAMYFEVTFG